jgi:hypothetical protein
MGKLRTGELFPNEEISIELGPRFLSFLGGFIPYIYLFALGAIALVYGAGINSLSDHLWILGSLLKPYLSLIVILLLLIVPAIIIGLLHISMRIILIFASISVMAIYIQFQGLPEIYRSVMFMGLGALGVILMETHRRSYRYGITNNRVILERTFPTHDRREIMLENIQDIALQQGLLGRIFNFGNVIPTSAAGVGTGEDLAGVHMAAGTKLPKSPLGFGAVISGGKGVTGFRTRPNNCLFGVPNPSDISNLVARLKFQRSEPTKLDEIKRAIDRHTEKQDTKDRSSPT